MDRVDLKICNHMVDNTPSRMLPAGLNQRRQTMTTKHTATFGSLTFTRSSKTRKYTHCVIATRSRMQALENALSKASQDLHRSNYAFFVKEGRTEQLHGAKTADAYVVDRVKLALDFIQARAEEGYYDTFIPVGWCGSKVLASKLEGQTRASKHFNTVLVLEAVQS